MKKPLFYLSINIDTDEEVTREPRDWDSWDNGDVRIIMKGVTATRVPTTGKYFEKDCPLPGETIFVLIEVHDTGSTFGTQEEVHTERGWFRTYEKADLASKRIPVYNDYFGGHNHWLIESVVVQDFQAPGKVDHEKMV